MAEEYRTDAELNALSATTQGGGTVIPEKDKDPHYTYLAKFWSRVADALIPLTGCEVYKDGDLTFAVRPGKYLNGDTEVNYAGAAAQALTNNATNYIYLTAAGTLTVNTTGFPTPSETPHIPLATIVTSAGNYSINDGDITDYRGRGIFSVCGQNSLTAAIADPGDAGAIPVTKSGTCPLVTAGAETRTLAIPSRVGDRLSLAFKTDGGDCVITVASPVNQANNNTLTFSDIGEHIMLVGIDEGAALAWRVMCNDGVVLSTV